MSYFLQLLQFGSFLRFFPFTGGFVTFEDVEPVYVKKSVPGIGILFCELGICEPFVYMKTYALEASRIPNTSDSPAGNEIQGLESLN